jgi:hypothetical protein
MLSDRSLNKSPNKKLIVNYSTKYCCKEIAPYLFVLPKLLLTVVQCHNVSIH